jgi:hypothetical protein
MPLRTLPFRHIMLHCIPTMIRNCIPNVVVSASCRNINGPKSFRFAIMVANLFVISNFIARAGPLAETAYGANGSVSPFYASDSFWNTPISVGAAVDPNSAAILATSISPYVATSNFANSNAWGISIVHASPTDRTYTIQKRVYYVNGPISFTIPAGARPTEGSDHHLVVINGGQELDLWRASYNAASDTWSAGSAFIVNPSGWGANAAPGEFAGGAVAAGFSEMGGVVRPEEIAQGHIDHALSITSPIIRSGYIAAPATATDGVSTDPNAIPEGAHIQLDPTFDVDAQNWPTWEKVIAKALQTYGAYVSDHGGSLAVYGQTDMNAGNTTWNSVGVPKGGFLNNIPWDRCRVLLLPAASTGAAIGPESTGNASGGGATLLPSNGASFGTGPDSIILNISEDAWANGDGTSDSSGDATFTVAVDGEQIGGTFIASASHSAGQDQSLTLNCTLGLGSHTVTVNFLNDAWGGTDVTDRNLYVDSVTYNGANTTQSSTLSGSGPKKFAIRGGTTIKADTANQPWAILDGTNVQSQTVYGASVNLAAPAVASVVLGSTSDTFRFLYMSSANVTAGSAESSVTANCGNNTFTAGNGVLHVRGGSGADAYVFHARDATLTVGDFSLAKGDTLTVDKSLAALMSEKMTSTGALLIFFGSNPGHITLANTTSLPTSAISFV